LNFGIIATASFIGFGTSLKGGIAIILLFSEGMYWNTINAEFVH
jgi:hypothetical protein